MTMRIIVAQRSPARDPSAQGPILPVGVVRWRAPEPRLTVIVKVTYALTLAPDGGVVLAAAEELLPLSCSLPLDLPGAAPGELAYATDFVPYKPSLDVALSGHAHAPSPATRINARLRVGGVRRDFVVAAGAPSTRIPLTSAYLRHPELLTPIEPVSAQEQIPAANREAAEGDFDTGHSLARRSMSGPYLSSGASIALVGLLPTGDGAASFPTRRPCALLDHGDQQQEVPLVCDTAWIDTDHALVVLVFRGSVAVESEITPAIEQIVISEAEGDRPVDWAAVKRALHRGSFTHAVEQEDLDGSRPPDPLDADELEAACCNTWDSGAPEPSIPIEQYAAISAELVERPDRRADMLKRYDFDENSWTVEERAWLERIAEMAERGDGSLAAEFGSLFLAAQDRLARPEEASVTIDEYVESLVAIETMGDAAKVLATRGLTLAQWMRVDRRWTREAAARPEIEADLERRLVIARAAAPRRADENDDAEEG